MEDALRTVLVESRGGPNRRRILRALFDRPRNANRLAADLDLDYKTVSHHLDVLADHDLVTANGGYGAVYVPTDRATRNREVVEEMLKRAGG